MRSSVILALALAVPLAIAADQAPADAPAKLDSAALDKRFQDIITQLRGKGLQQGETVDPAKLKDQMDQLDEAIARAADPKGDAAVKMRMLRGQVFEIEGKRDDAAKAYQGIIDDGVTGDAATAAWQMLAADLQEAGKGDELAKLADAAEKAKQDPELVARMRGMAKAAGIQPGKPFPEFSLTDTAGTERKLADYKGKVLLVDFWATWCGPCVHEMPNVKAAYDAYHDKGFEILGISLDQDRAKLDKFIADKGIPWPQFFDGKGWSNAIAMQFGIQSIPAPFLIGPDGNLIGKDLRGEELKQAIEKALPKQ